MKIKLNMALLIIGALAEMEIRQATDFNAFEYKRYST
jgi:hypothetical protein